MLRHILYFYSICCSIVNRVTAIGCVHIAESVGSRRELVANNLHTADADATQLDSSSRRRRRCVLGLKYTQSCASGVASMREHRRERER